MIEALIAGFIIGTVVILFAVMCCMVASGEADKGWDITDKEDEEEPVIDIDLIEEDNDENK